MRWNSFRVRLSIWNVTVLTMLLGTFGLALYSTLQNEMRRTVDRELTRRVARDAGPFGRMPGAPGPGDGRRFGGFPFGRFPGPPPGPDRGRVPQGLPGETEAQRAFAFRFPRFIGPDGRNLFPWETQGPWDPDTVRAALDGHERFSTIVVAGDRVRVLSAPWYREGQIAGVIQVAHELGEYDRLWQGQLRTLLTLLPIALLVVGVGGLFLTDRALRPVHQVTQAAAQIGAEDLSRRLKVTGRDELAQMAATFNAMIARLEASFERQRRFTADASHELRTPLARIKVSTSMALSGEQSPAEYRTALVVADQAADVMARLIQQLLTLARADAGELRLRAARVDLGVMLREAELTFARADAARLVLDLPAEPIEISGDEDHLSRVFANLLENAIRHTPPEGEITISARATDDTAVVRVRDTGEGIPPEHLPHVCERFYRVDAARARKSGGSGLGLAICQSIVQAHGGSLCIESEVGEGTVVTVTLPRSPAPLVLDAPVHALTPGSAA